MMMCGEHPRSTSSVCCESASNAKPPRRGLRERANAGGHCPTTNAARRVIGQPRHGTCAKRPSISRAFPTGLAAVVSRTWCVQAAAPLRRLRAKCQTANITKCHHQRCASRGIPGSGGATHNRRSPHVCREAQGRLRRSKLSRRLPRGRAVWICRVTQEARAEPPGPGRAAGDDEHRNGRAGLLTRLPLRPGSVVGCERGAHPRKRRSLARRLALQRNRQLGRVRSNAPRGVPAAKRGRRVD